ncbi:apolipoprotein D-like [Photinus pyralis]|uniref:Lipocalin/cytosolic fatty-acid binding domain-containing protein n=1 Tax=Photinus pyralis TaxID=7054 RepID=A0A1Y1LV13_PHOPY|nr:apolipoprotein D-like [Photinus pyralis]
MHRTVLLAVVSALVFAPCGGTCPDVDPEVNFDVNKILGHWYIVQQTGAKHPCLTLNFTKKADKDEYRMIETCQSSKFFNTLGLQYEHHTKGKLRVPNATSPAIMDLSYTLSIRTLKLTIFATDYENYLGFLTCIKGFAFSNKPQVTIASRTPGLGPPHLEPVYAKLLKYNINPYVIDTVKQYECAEHGEKGIFVKAVSGTVDTVKGAIGSVVNLFSSGKKDSNLDPKITGENEIDVRAGQSQ